MLAHKRPLPLKAGPVSFKRLLDGAGTLPHLHEIQFTIATHREPAQESGYVIRRAGDVIDKHRGAPGHLRRIAVGERQVLVVAHEVSKDSRVKTVALDSVIAYADSGGRRARTHEEVSTIPVSEPREQMRAPGLLEEQDEDPLTVELSALHRTLDCAV